MSYILKTDTAIDQPEIYFGGWVSRNSKNPVLSEELRFARHWGDKTNCKRFLARNADILIDKHKFYVERVIADRFCEFCGLELDQYTRTDAKYCSDECRLKAFKESL